MLNPFSGALKATRDAGDTAAVARVDAEIYGYCPPDIITAAGFIAVHAHVDEACPDDWHDYGKGFMEMYPFENNVRPDNGFGAIGAWAFCGSRVVDWLLTQGDVRSDFIAVCGHSRAGKTALWCGAQDERVAVTISNNSGCSGAAITRGKEGERIADITRVFPFWFCPRYAEYANREEKLPVDQHMLLALCAPRPVYISSASDDQWADPRKEFESAVLSGAAYELYGKTGLPTAEYPANNTPLQTGDVGYHVRTGPHACEVYDWQQFIEFMKKYI